VLIAAMLQAPQVLYHREQLPGPVASEGGLVRLGPHEMASRLSYFLWASMPDATLFAAADAGRLTTADEIGAQARRMLASPRTRVVVEDFITTWLDLANVADLTKSSSRFSPALARSMAAETRAFADEVMLGDQASPLKTLLTAPWSFVDAPLAQLYGIAAPAGGGVQRVNLDPSQRAGILTQGSFLARHAYDEYPSPDERGGVVLDRLLCLNIPPPPPVAPPPPPPLPGQTTRERHQAEIASPSCQPCHALLDPPGFAFENYDGLGAYRATDAGKTVDASGKLEGVVDPPLGFRNAIDLLGQLAGRHEVAECFARQWFRYAMRRREVPEEEDKLVALVQGLKGAGLGDLLIALAQSSQFRYRQPGSGEVLR
jgi:hypothetical protein